MMKTLVCLWQVMSTLRDALPHCTPADAVEIITGVVGFKDHLMKDETGDER